MAASLKSTTANRQFGQNEGPAVGYSSLQEHHEKELCDKRQQEEDQQGIWEKGERTGELQDGIRKKKIWRDQERIRKEQEQLQRRQQWIEMREWVHHFIEQQEKHQKEKEMMELRKKQEEKEWLEREQEEKKQKEKEMRQTEQEVKPAARQDVTGSGSLPKVSDGQ